jgi:hypothetical protein
VSYSNMLHRSTKPLESAVTELIVDT